MDRPQLKTSSLSFTCPCPASILNEIVKLEKNNQLDEISRTFDLAINYHRQAFLQLQAEREKFRSRHAQKEKAFQYQDNRTYLASQTVDGCSSTRCDSTYQIDPQLNHDINCPVAIFQPPNPGEKLMYPKHLIYADGKDAQFEEVIWHLKQSNAIPLRTAMQIENIPFNGSNHETVVATPSEMQPLSSSKPSAKENNSEKDFQIDKTYVLEPTDTTEKNDEKNHQNHPQVDKTFVLKAIENQLPPASPFTPRKNRQKEEMKTTNRNEIADFDDKENRNPKSPIFDNDSQIEVNDENDSFDGTLTFSRPLVSSTPRMSSLFHRTSLQSNFERRNLNYVRRSVAAQPDPNLTMIVELSRERSTSSGKENINESKTQTIRTELGKKSSEDYRINLSDPFNEELIEHFLQMENVKDKCNVDRYHRVEKDMPTIKSSTNLRLGSDKYTVIEELGKGNYGRVFKARVVAKEVAIKIQKPACLWEFYISEEIRRRLQTFDKCQYFMQYWSIYMYNNGSALLSDCAAFGSLLEVVNSIKSCLGQPACPIIVATHASIQLLSIVEYLHSCKIIHGDIKPDNFVVTSPPSNSKPYLKLIDYGRSIDMTLFPDEQKFNAVVATEDFTCHEMKDGKPWTYQTDLFGLASTMYLLLVGDYMKTVKRDGVWITRKQLPRYYRDFWDPIFNILLNIRSCDEIPDLSIVKEMLKTEYANKYDKYAIQEQFNKISSVFSRK